MTSNSTHLPRPDRPADAPWLEPYPDVLLDDLAHREPGPEARYGAEESISLAFIRALQALPPYQRTVIALCDVVGFRAAEAAEIMEMTVDALDSTLERARAGFRKQVARHAERPAAPPPGSPVERELMRQLTQAYATRDADRLIPLLTEDVLLTMPPGACEYRGREVAAQMLRLLFASGRIYRLVATRANGQPAFGLYVRDPSAEVMRADGLLVVTVAGDRICALSGFDNSSIARFGLPRILPA